MKPFLQKILLVFTFVIIVLELVLRIFNLAGHTVPNENLNGNILGVPGTDSVWVRGGVGEISTHYHINNLGWNSVKDYHLNEDKNKRNKIVLIGDSYIQGFHVPVEESIGRTLEHLTKNQYEVYEFGKAGGNIVDFLKVYEGYELQGFKYVFVLVSDKDLIETDAFYMGKGEIMKDNEESILRVLYDNIYFLRYFNINFKVTAGLKEILKKPFKNISKSKGIESKGAKKRIEWNFDALKRFGSNVVFVYEDGKIANPLEFHHKSIEIVHSLLPKDCGFDKHWNKNGRMNCAVSISRYVEKSDSLMAR